MRTWVDNDLINAGDAVEHLLKKYPDLTLEEKVDAGARLRAIVKNAEKIDEQIKAEIKIRRKQKPGSVLGEAFKAVLGVFPVTRLDQQALKADLPDVYSKYERTDDQKRVTYEPR